MIIAHITEKLIQIQMRGKGEVLCILLDGFNHMLSRAVYSQHAVGITGRIQNYASQRGDLRFYSLLQRPVLIARHNKRAVHGGISYVNARAVVFDLVENTGKQHASHLVGPRIYEDAVRQPKLAHSLCNGHLVQRRIPVLGGIVLWDGKHIEYTVPHQVHTRKVDRPVHRAARQKIVQNAVRYLAPERGAFPALRLIRLSPLGLVRQACITPYFSSV